MIAYDLGSAQLKHLQRDMAEALILSQINILTFSIPQFILKYKRKAVTLGYIHITKVAAFYYYFFSIFFSSNYLLHFLYLFEHFFTFSLSF
jgi:hypothetical protein